MASGVAGASNSAAAQFSRVSSGPTPWRAAKNTWGSGRITPDEPSAAGGSPVHHL